MPNSEDAKFLQFLHTSLIAGTIILGPCLNIVADSVLNMTCSVYSALSLIRIMGEQAYPLIETLALYPILTSSNISEALIFVANTIKSETNQTKIQDLALAISARIALVLLCNHEFAAEIMIYTNYRNNVCTAKKCIYGESLRVGIYGRRQCVANNSIYMLITEYNLKNMCPADNIFDYFVTRPLVCEVKTQAQPILSSLPQC